MKNAIIKRSVATGVIFIILIGSLLYYSFQQQEANVPNPKYSPALSSLDWLLGTWENNQDSLLFQEIWKVKDYNSIEGDGYLLQGKDTSFHENLTILHLNGQILYITQFTGQEAVMFNLTSSEGNYLVFENKEHIYPNKITYNLVNDSTMVAGLEGKNQFGEFVKREFNYYREK